MSTTGKRSTPRLDTAVLELVMSARVSSSRFLARRRLGAAPIVFFTVAAAAPLTVIAGGAVSGWSSSGVIGLPIGYAVMAAVLALFATGFTAMAREITNAGSFYAYIRYGLGRLLGVCAAFVAVPTYNILQVSLYGIFGAASSDLVRTTTGLDAPWWLLAGVAWAVIGFLGWAKVDVSGRVLAVLLIAEALAVLAFDGTFLTHPGDAGVSTSALAPSQLLQPGVGTILVVAFTGFIGFESAAVFAEEARDPRRTIARAIYVAVTTIGLLYALSTWAMTVTIGPDHIITAAEQHETQLLFVLAQQHLPNSLVLAGNLLFATSLFAGLLAWHNVAARYHFALGREGVLPTWLGRTNPRTGAPHTGSATQTAFSGIVLVIMALSGLDPTEYLFFWGASWGALGVLIMLVATASSVVIHFLRERRPGWSRTIAPAASCVILAVVLVLTVLEFATTLGVPDDDPAAWILPACYGVIALAGAAWALWLRARHPQVWHRIGHGAHATTTPEPPSKVTPTAAANEGGPF